MENFARFASTDFSSSSDLLDATIKTSTTARVIELERRLEGSRPAGDFEGSVTGYWKQLNDLGVGEVDYKGRTYKTRPIGFISVPKGTEIELTYANGVYYSKF